VLTTPRNAAGYRAKFCSLVEHAQQLVKRLRLAKTVQVSKVGRVAVPHNNRHCGSNLPKSSSHVLGEASGFAELPGKGIDLLDYLDPGQPFEPLAIDRVDIVNVLDNCARHFDCIGGYQSIQWQSRAIRNKFPPRLNVCVYDPRGSLVDTWAHACLLASLFIFVIAIICSRRFWCKPGHAPTRSR
jgi:hypothetical protein